MQGASPLTTSRRRFYLTLLPPASSSPLIPSPVSWFFCRGRRCRRGALAAAATATGCRGCDGARGPPATPPPGQVRPAPRDVTKGRACAPRNLRRPPGTAPPPPLRDVRAEAGRGREEPPGQRSAAPRGREAGTEGGGGPGQVSRCGAALPPGGGRRAPVTSPCGDTRGGTSPARDLRALRQPGGARSRLLLAGASTSFACTWNNGPGVGPCCPLRVPSAPRPEVMLRHKERGHRRRTGTKWFFVVPLLLCHCELS